MKCLYLRIKKKRFDMRPLTYTIIHIPMSTYLSNIMSFLQKLTSKVIILFPADRWLLGICITTDTDCGPFPFDYNLQNRNILYS